jgi:phospholipase D1/2
MNVLHEGETCWRIERADRWAFLVDAKAYYRAFHEAVEKAQRAVRLLAWDFDDGVSLRGAEAAEPRLGALLERAAGRGVHVDILAWDWPLFMAAVRRWFPMAWSRWSSSNLHFSWGRHPLHGGSHHQKVAVIDDALAFVGGIDFARMRWDTRQHRSDNPYHDVMVAFDGPAGAALAELVRARLPGARCPAVGSDASNAVWPASLTADLVEVPVGIARTDPGSSAYEIEALYVHAIRSARRRIYIENQYLASKVVWLELARRLREPRGPEVFVVVPERCVSAAEWVTMGLVRERWARRLRRMDRYGRLRVAAPRGEHRSVFVHSKVLIVDDDLAVVGSANLTARSLRLDTECAVAVEANGNNDWSHGIRRFRDGLLAEHLGARPADVASALAGGATFAQVAQRLAVGQRGFMPVGLHAPAWWERSLPDEAIIDPPGPMRSCAYGIWLMVRTTARVAAGGLSRRVRALWRRWVRAMPWVSDPD